MISIDAVSQYPLSRVSRGIPGRCECACCPFNFFAAKLWRLPLYFVGLWTDREQFPYSWSSHLFYQMGKDILEFSVVGVTKSKLAARSLYEPARCFGVNIDPVFPNSVFEYRRILVADRGLKWKARLAGGSGGILHSYES
ncbi:hypothetical protein J6590_067418 [Homalodisca vitripennis]|nr:hypothetical protein J6590_067418 [Homalodisca vitripennis]